MLPFGHSGPCQWDCTIEDFEYGVYCPESALIDKVRIEAEVKAKLGDNPGRKRVNAIKRRTREVIRELKRQKRKCIRRKNN